MARKSKNIIWCEVTCRCCGDMSAASGYYSPERIKKIKDATKDWIEDEEYNVLCPDCQKKLGRK